MENKSRHIREVWAFDWQSHGDSAVLNQHLLSERQYGICEFVYFHYHLTMTEKKNSSVRMGCSLDILPSITSCKRPSYCCYRTFSRGRSDVCITPNAPLPCVLSARTSILTTKEIPLHELPYCAIILVEPSLVTRELFDAHIEDRLALMDLSVAATSARRDTWKSRGEAFRYFSKRTPWKTWNPRMVNILTVSDGFHSPPSPT
jgi:hypothetical protein